MLITPQAVVHYTPQWIGRLEHSIHMAHVASVSIDTNLMFSDVYIETTGGTTPIHCKGHRKGDALEMKRLIEQYQTTYYQQRGKAPDAPSRSGPLPSRVPAVPCRAAPSHAARRMARVRGLPAVARCRARRRPP